MYEWLATPKYYENAYDATITAIAVLKGGIQSATFIETHGNDEVYTTSMPGTRYGHEIATCNIHEEDEDDDDDDTTTADDGDYLYIYETSKNAGRRQIRT